MPVLCEERKRPFLLSSCPRPAASPPRALPAHRSPPWSATPQGSRPSGDQPGRNTPSLSSQPGRRLRRHGGGGAGREDGVLAGVRLADTTHNAPARRTQSRRLPNAGLPAAQVSESTAHPERPRPSPVPSALPPTPCPSSRRRMCCPLPQGVALPSHGSRFLPPPTPPKPIVPTEFGSEEAASPPMGARLPPAPGRPDRPCGSPAPPPPFLGPAMLPGRRCGHGP